MQFSSTRVRAVFLLQILATAKLVVGLPETSVAQESDARVLPLLALRARQQAEALQGSAVIRDFKFEDRIAESGIKFEHHVVDDAGKNWKPAHYDHGNGVAIADVDGDGKLDLYFADQLRANELWRNLGNGRFENITPLSGLALSNQISVAASFADIDNDGDPDLFVTTVRHGNHLFENLGGGKFRDISREAAVNYPGHSSGAIFFDYDRDGLLDLFVCNVGIYTDDAKSRDGFYFATTNAFSAHLDSKRVEYSLLYRNLGGRKFKEVSSDLGLRDGGWSGDASVCDVNQDGFPDLYVLNMQGDNHYWENQGGKRFVEKTAQYFPKTPWGAMGIRFFDFNNDGLFDLYLTDMHSDMTKQQGVEALKFPLSVEKAKSERWCMERWSDSFLQGASNNIFGNAFYVNKDNGKFEEASDRLGTETYWPWGPSTGDLNADGFQDLFVTAGMGHPFRYAINSVLLNDAGKAFVDAEFALGVEPRKDGRCSKIYFTLDCDGADKGNVNCGGKTGTVPFNAAISTRSSVVFDVDDDGDLDIVTNEFNDRPQFLVSNLSSKRQLRWLKIAPRGSKSNRDALGAIVKVQAGGKSFTQCHDGKSGYLAQSSVPLYFGLGDATKVDRIEVTWPSGRKQSIDSVEGVNRLLTLQEPAE